MLLSLRVWLTYGLFSLVACAVLGMSALADAQEQPFGFEFQKQAVEANSSLRGLCVVDARTVWATGSQGTILRTTDGEHWQSLGLPKRDEVEIRDVFAWDAEHAIVMIAGQPAELWETENGGANWRRVFVDGREKAFLDDIWIDPKTGEGLAFGDVVFSALPLVKREPSGQWFLWEDTADLSDIGYLHGYAASGTSMVRVNSGRFLLGTGGSRDNLGTSIVLISDAKHWRRWKQVPCEIAGTESAGIFSLATDEKTVVAVGGDYLKPDANERVASYSFDAGETWQTAETMPKGFRSGAAFVPTVSDSAVFMCVGTNGSDVSWDGGKNWQPINSLNLNAVRFDGQGNIGWAVGGNGSVYRITVTKH